MFMVIQERGLIRKMTLSFYVNYANPLTDIRSESRFPHLAPGQEIIF